jgi:hypothetical protein
MMWYVVKQREVKVKLSCALTKHHATNAYWMSGGIVPHILELGTRWRWVVSFTPRPLYPQGKSLWYPLNRSLGGPQSRSGRGGEEKNSQTLPGLEPPIIQVVAKWYITELSRLLSTWRTLPFNYISNKGIKGIKKLRTERNKFQTLWNCHEHFSDRPVFGVSDSGYILVLISDYETEWQGIWPVTGVVK